MPLTTHEAAKQLGVTPRRIQKLIADKRIPGAVKPGHDWIIPDDFMVLPVAGRTTVHPAGKIEFSEEEPAKKKRKRAR
jgi:excisionase family DNA binding protein